MSGAIWRDWRGGPRGDGPAAVFIHGWLMDHTEEADSLDAAFAAAGYARLYLDLPGMGLSRDAAVPHDLDGYLAAIRGVLTEELGGRPYVLCGTSAGACLARGIAAAAGAQVRGVVLRVPLIQPRDDLRDVDAPAVLRADPALIADLPRPMAALLDGPPLIQTRGWIAALAGKLDALILPAMRRARRGDLDAVRSDPARYAVTGADQWPDFAAPALVVLARQDDSVGWRDGLAATAHWPRATVAILDAAGHEFPLSHQKPLFEALIADFLRRLDEAP